MILLTFSVGVITAGAGAVTAGIVTAGKVTAGGFFTMLLRDIFLGWWQRAENTDPST